MTQDRSGSITIPLRGEFDLANCAGIIRQVHAALTDARAARIVLDMSEVTFVDSTTLGAMIVARNSCMAAGAALTVVDGSPQVRRILRITGCGALFDVTDATVGML